MQMDEVALGALLPPPGMPAVRPLDEVSIEIVFEDDDLADAAKTMQFVRFSAPYERIELSEVAPLPQRRARRTTFVKTVATLANGTPSTGVPTLRPTVEMPAVVEASATVEMPAMRAATLEMPLAAPPSVTVPFERVWFDDEQPEKLAAIEEPATQPKTSWWWLAISLAAGGAAVAWMASLA
ncbi:MAG TPA: hypothetical protein VLT45_03540 [Kofleriaceae bacterium]|nr:hypothetical protein [Kofleriaceae bacterium]